MRKKTELPWINEGLRLSGPAMLDGEKGYAMLHTTQRFLYTGETEPLALTWYPYNGGAVNMYDCKTMPAAVTYVDDDRLIIDTPELRKAHTANDRAVMQAYGMPIKETDEAACVAWLMRLYQEMTEKK